MLEVGIAGDVGAGGPGPFYVEVIVPDEQKFFQGKKIVMRLGKLFGWVEGGRQLYDRWKSQGSCELGCKEEKWTVLVYSSILENEAVECMYKLSILASQNPSSVLSILLLLFAILRQPPRHHRLRHILNSPPLHII